jgi:hypothetical protein
MATTAVAPTPLRIGKTGLTWALVCLVWRGRVDGGAVPFGIDASVLDVVELGTVVPKAVDEVKGRVVGVRLMVDVVVCATDELVVAEIGVVLEVGPVLVLLVFPVVVVVAACEGAGWGRARMSRMKTAAPVAASTPNLRMAASLPGTGGSYGARLGRSGTIRYSH